MSLWIPKELTTVSLVLVVMVNSLYGKLSVVIKALHGVYIAVVLLF